MRTLFATTAIALTIATVTHAQTEPSGGQAEPEATQQPAEAQQPAEGEAQQSGEEGEAAQAPAETPAEADLEDQAEVGGAVGLATGAIGETFFIRAPQEFHLLVSEMPGHPVFFDTTPTGMARPVTEEPEAAGTVEEAIRQGEAPLGVVADVVLDRRGGAAGLVVELDEEMRGGAREVAIAMGLVRMLADPNDPASTHILITLDPVDIENAPTFERPGAAPDVGAAEVPQDAQPAEEEAADAPAGGGGDAPAEGEVAEDPQPEGEQAPPQQ